MGQGIVRQSYFRGFISVERRMRWICLYVQKSTYSIDVYNAPYLKRSENHLVGIQLLVFLHTGLM